MNYMPVIGLEVHVELKTKSKMFCGCSADYFGKKPNTHTCPVCLGLPGALPVPNKTAIEWCAMIGLALNCKIPLFSKFDRKNYFYPDLPKGYQISQYDQPFAVNGYVILNSFQDLARDGNKMPKQVRHDNQGKQIRIRRVHMEEDTGKLIHTGDSTLIDFNRSGVPLVEVVTEPDFESATEVVEYLKKLQQLVRYLDVSNADMEKGEMRLEPNISLHVTRDTAHEKENVLRVTGHVLPSYKVEVKNINSFKFAEKAIEYEIKRQNELLNRGKTPTQETRGWDESKQKTISQRSKEEAHDYRYFPEPDIPPIRWTEISIRKLADQIGELPDEKKERFEKDYSLSDYNAEILTREKKLADYFEETVNDVSSIKYQVSSKKIADWIVNKKVDIRKMLPAALIQRIITASQTVSIDENKLQEVVKKVIEENKKAIEDYKEGKVQVLGFLLGQVKKVFPNADVYQLKTALERLILNT